MEIDKQKLIVGVLEGVSKPFAMSSLARVIHLPEPFPHATNPLSTP